MLTRWRHKHGFGIHSPFAYEVVTRALFPKGCAWYGYRTIDHAIGKNDDESVRRIAKMLLRLCSMMHPRSVFISSSAHKAFTTALRIADSATIFERNPHKADSADLLCTHGDLVDLDKIIESLRHPGHWVMIRDIPRDWREKIEEELPEGLVFFGRRNLIAFNRPDMQKISYEMPID